MMEKPNTIVWLFQEKKNTQNLKVNVDDTSSLTSDISISNNSSTKSWKVNTK